MADTLTRESEEMVSKLVPKITRIRDQMSEDENAVT
jgi:hypothetical protein